MKSRIILFLLFLTSVVGLSLTITSTTLVTAAPMTYTVTSTACTGPGSITEAINLANANPGEDTIELTSKLQIDAGGCPALGEIQPSDYVIAEVTDSLIIEGNDGALIGKMYWNNSGGRQSFTNCPTRTPGTLILATMPGFLRIGEVGQDNTGLQVTMKNLRVQEFNQAAQVRKNASLVMENVYLEDIYSWRYCSDPAIDAHEGASVTLRQTTIDNYISFTEQFAFETPAVAGGANAGDLTIENSQLFRINADFPQPTIYWDGAPGSRVNIVSTLFGDTGSTATFSAENGGIHVLGSAETNIVNSLWNNDLEDAPDPGDIIWNASSGDMNIIASTLIWNSDDCDTGCQQTGIEPAFFYRSGTGRINFEQSAIGINFLSTPPSLLTLRDAQTNGFTADADTWIQPTQRQDAAALRAITGQPALRTDSPAFDVPQFSSVAALGTPSVGTASNPGQLIDVIPDANCGNSNQLLNPIDNSCIDKDVLGNSRWDTGNNKRNIGAVQLTLAPHLTVTGTGDQTVDLSWTKPQVSSASTITGYELHYREKGTASWTSIPISGPDTLTNQVTGLTNGMEYEFEVRATYSPSGTGPYSNNVTAVPVGPIGAPVVTATPGNAQVDLSWTKADDGGHIIDSYSILWRPTGASNWIGAQAVFGTDGNPPATQTTITGLTNGIEYEFAVTANAVDGAFGPKGLATAKPFAPGMVVITKLTSPSGGTGFSFRQDLDNSGNFTLNDQGSKSFNSVVPGTYMVTEDAPEGLGYYLTNISCVDGDHNGVASSGDAATRTATINVESGETVQCSFYNAEEETVVIEKRTQPPGGSGFNFSHNIAAPDSFNLDDAETRTFTNVQPGSYQVTEATMPGYELTAIDCTVEGVNVPSDLASRTANINLQQPGGNAHCTFTNTKLGTIIMRKETLPDGATETFGYTISGPDYGDSGTLTDGDSQQVDNAKPGEWTLAETLPSADWHLGAISCTSTLGTSIFTENTNNLEATVELAPGDTVDCTFTNVEEDTITVEKATVPSGDTTTMFTFTGSGSIGSFDLKHGEKQSFKVDAKAGPYTLSEEDPSGSGYEVTEIHCVNSQTGEITLGEVSTRTVVLNTQPGDSQHCTFTNERHGQVVIRKATAPGGGRGFGFYGSFGSFSLDDDQEETFIDVAPGAYSVSEVDPTSLGYGLTDISCTDSDPNGTSSIGDVDLHTATVNVDAGETVECTFTNAKSGPTPPKITYLPVIAAGYTSTNPTPNIGR